MKPTSALLASAFLVGTSNAQCNNGACVFDGAPFKSTCYMTNGACHDCPAGELNNYFAVDSQMNPIIDPSGTPDLTNQTACTAQPICAQKFNEEYLPWPAWLSALEDDEGLPFSEDDIPSFVQLIYGFYAGEYPTANISDPATQAILAVDEATDVYVELFPNGEDDCGQTDSACQDISLPSGATLPVLNGMKFAVAECTKLIFTGAPLYLQFRTGEQDGEVTCEYGLFLGHGCDWGETGSEYESPTVLVDQANSSCAPFPADQGFQLKVSCHDLSTGNPKSFRNSANAVLDRSLHDSTCREEGRVQFPCEYPSFCSDVAIPIGEAYPDSLFPNATRACETEIISGVCADIQSCLTQAHEGNFSLGDYYTDCIQNMCPDESSASIVAGSLAMAFLALF